jgi:hypothetical protein
MAIPNVVLVPKFSGGEWVVCLGTLHPQMFAFPKEEDGREKPTLKLIVWHMEMAVMSADSGA